MIHVNHRIQFKLDELKNDCKKVEDKSTIEEPDECAEDEIPNNKKPPEKPLPRVNFDILEKIDVDEFNKKNPQSTTENLNVSDLISQLELLKENVNDPKIKQELSELCDEILKSQEEYNNLLQDLRKEFPDENNLSPNEKSSLETKKNLLLILQTSNESTNFVQQYMDIFNEMNAKISEQNDNNLKSQLEEIVNEYAEFVSSVAKSVAKSISIAREEVKLQWSFPKYPNESDYVKKDDKGNEIFDNEKYENAIKEYESKVAEISSKLENLGKERLSIYDEWANHPKQSNKLLHEFENLMPKQEF